MHCERQRRLAIKQCTVNMAIKHCESLSDRDVVISGANDLGCQSVLVGDVERCLKILICGFDIGALRLRRIGYRFQV